MGTVERRAREKERRRKAIVDSAEKIFFRKGFEAATMDEIAEAAELSKGTLYLYFSCKEDLYFAVTKRGLDILTEMFEQAEKNEEIGLARVRAVGAAYFAFSRKHPDYFQSLMFFDLKNFKFDTPSPMAEACSLQGDRLIHIVARAVAGGIEDGSIRSDLDPLKTALFLWSMSNGIRQMLASKWEHFRDHHKDFSLSGEEEFIEYSFFLASSALEPRRKDR